MGWGGGGLESTADAPERMTQPEPDNKGGGVAGIRAEETACAKGGNVHRAEVSEEPGRRS